MSRERWESETPFRWESDRDRVDAQWMSEKLAMGIEDTRESIDALTREVVDQQRLVDQLERLLDERRALLVQLRDLAVREREATTATRKAERQLAAERARTAVRPDDGIRKRDGRLVRVKADDGAWRTVRAEAERRQVVMGVYLARLVDAEIDDETDRSLPPSRRRRRSPGEGGEPKRVVHALRVFVTEDQWVPFRSCAAQLGLGLGVYVGELVEAEARRLGWRA